MKRKIVYSIIILLVLMITSSHITDYVMADEGTNLYCAVSKSNELENYFIPDIIDDEEASDYLGRLKENEKDLYTLIFVNNDGTNTMRVFGHPVKYLEKDGSVKDISLSLKKESNGSFVSAEHMVNITFNPCLNDGISLKYEDIDVLMKSAYRCDKANISESKKEITYDVDKDTSFVYSLTYAGLKENIIVNEYTGQTQYDFIFNTNGLHPIRKNGSIFLANKDDCIKVNIGDVLVYSADEKHNAIAELYYETLIKDQEYRFTIVLDPDYLKETIYPIIIDPTIEIKYSSDGAGAIEDITLNQFYTLSGSSSNLYVGRDTNTSLNRTLMRFPNLSLNNISSSQILSAYVELTDIAPVNNQDIIVECYIYKQNAPAWTESGTTTWSGVGNNYIGDYLDEQIISSGNGNAGTNKYSFSIYSAAKKWALETQNPARGLVFKADDEFEAQTGNSIQYYKKTFASYNRITDAPSLKIVYKNPIPRNYHYSIFDPGKYDVTGEIPEVGDYTYEIRYRQNCYGYAFGFIKDGLVQIDSNGKGYKQRPGELAKTNRKPYLKNILDNTQTTSELMESVCYNIEADAERINMGTCQEYHVNGSTVPQVGCPGSATRLIAVVTGKKLYMSENDVLNWMVDFHFYMQHDDHTWSHKTGSDGIRNTSLEKNNNNEYDILDNSNIKALANQGFYNGGDLRFYEISKNAAMDFSHNPRCCNYMPCNHIQTSLTYLERAGDYLQNSKLMSQPDSIFARFDYLNDHDVYCFTPPETRYYTISINSPYNDVLKHELRDNCGVSMQSGAYAGNTSYPVRLVHGIKYYFDISNNEHKVDNYYFTIT